MPRAKGPHFFRIGLIVMKLPNVVRYDFSFYTLFCFSKSDQNWEFERPKTVFYGTGGIYIMGEKESLK